MAASYARRAKNADDVEEFAEHLKKTIRAFNSAIEAMSYCVVQEDE
jgi:hypothetical protein